MVMTKNQSCQTRDKSITPQSLQQRMKGLDADCLCCRLVNYVRTILACIAPSLILDPPPPPPTALDKNIHQGVCIPVYPKILLSEIRLSKIRTYPEQKH